MKSNLRHLQNAVNAGKSGKSRRVAKKVTSPDDVMDAGVTIVAEGLTADSNKVRSAAMSALANLNPKR